MIMSSTFDRHHRFASNAPVGFFIPWCCDGATCAGEEIFEEQKRCRDTKRCVMD